MAPAVTRSIRLDGLVDLSMTSSAEGSRRRRRLSIHMKDDDRRVLETENGSQFMLACVDAAARHFWGRPVCPA
jgi:hypothetical protein